MHQAATMSQKYLHELLKEDQEPFKLKNYIADRRLHVKRSSLNSTTQLLQAKKPKGNPSCGNACFLTFNYNNTQELTKSPLFQFSSPARNSNAVFIHVPARTAALLLQAAMRIEKNSACTKTKNRVAGFGVFGSVFKRLKHTSETQRGKKILGDKVKMAIKDMLSKNMKRKSVKSCGETSCYELSSAGWSQSNEEKSFETSSSGRNFGEFHDSPFHFVLQRSRTTELSSPAASPRAHRNQDKDVKNLSKFQGGEEEDEKEQCSPVSVLDPPFQDDEDGHDPEGDDEVFDRECSYEFVHRVKQQLLQKLCRFKKLAELDPVDLGKRILQQENGNYDDKEEEIDDKEEHGNEDDFIFEVLRGTSLFKQQKVTRAMKRLVLDLAAEEVQQRQSCFIDCGETVNRVCKRLESWNNVELNTIDMMVEQDLNTEQISRKSHQDEVGEIASQVELAIFGLLVEELAEELVHRRAA